MSKTYKVWMHLEEISVDEYGNEIFNSLDDEYLPQPIAEFGNKEAAIALMEEMCNFP